MIGSAQHQHPSPLHSNFHSIFAARKVETDVSLKRKLGWSSPKPQARRLTNGGSTFPESWEMFVPRKAFGDSVALMLESEARGRSPIKRAPTLKLACGPA